MDKRYDYPSVVAVKIVLKKGDSILLVREPETNEWMPGRINLPGGKLLLNESIPQALERKIKTEIGLRVDVKGLIKIVNILMPQKNIYHLIYFAEYVNGEIGERKTESDDLKWYNKSDLEKLSVDDYGEYYNARVIDDAINNKCQIISNDFISVQDNREADIMEWMEKGAK